MSREEEIQHWDWYHPTHQSMNDRGWWVPETLEVVIGSDFPLPPTWLQIAAV